MKISIMIFILLIFSNSAFAVMQSVDSAQDAPDDEAVPDLKQFGFGPAFYMISYKEEVLKDTKDVTVRGDGTISASGSKYNTAIGLEVHYDISIWGNRYGRCRDPNTISTKIVNGKSETDCGSGGTNWKHSNGFLASPYIGVYDIENGINGLTAGVVFGYWKGDGNFENRSSINFGIGYTVHRDQLVLSDGVTEGAAPPGGLTSDDYTTRKDVEGVILMVSVSTNF
jgi:hypothetical protein